MYIKTLRSYSDNCMRYLNYINGGSFFESVSDPTAGKFSIYYEADDDPDPDVSKAEDDENPEVSDSNDDENPEVSSSDDDTSNDNDASDTDSTSDNDDSSNTKDDSNDDNSSDSADSNNNDDNDDNGSSDNDSTSDDNTEDGSNDMDSDPHSVSGDDEDPDASSSDDKSSDDNNGKDDDKKEDKPGTDFENMRRYNLYKKFMTLNDSINGYTDTLDALVYDDDTLNAITKTASQKLKQLSEIMYDYMTLKFENDSYTQALLFYHEINAGVRMCFDLLESGNMNNRKRQ